MKHSQKEIAELFSHGRFEVVFPYLSDSIVWKIVGENVLNGKPDVVSYCKKTSEYFGSIDTIFVTDDITITENKVIIRGSGEFIRDGKRINLIAACDFYEFNRNGELEKISSYCIPAK